MRAICRVVDVVSVSILSMDSGVALEVGAGFSQPQTVIPFEFTTVRWASASLVLNVPIGARQLPYILGGYTRIQYGSDPPFNYGDHALHGAIGDRIFLFPGGALRLEGRAIFAPQTDPRFGGRCRISLRKSSAPRCSCSACS